MQFSHPLLARGVYTDASPSRRRAAHRALAGVVEQPELKARHLAMSTASADADVLQALDEAADSARARGAPAAAAELVDFAIRLGGDTPVRRVRAAEHYFYAGDLQHADACLQPALEQLPAGPMRAVASILRAGLWIYVNRVVEGASLLKEALDDAQGIPQLRVRALPLLAMAQFHGGEFSESFALQAKPSRKPTSLAIPH